MGVGKLSDYLDAVNDRLAGWTADRLKAISHEKGGSFPPDRTDHLELAKVAWFRGQASNWPLVPRLYQFSTYNRARESKLNLDCRAMARWFPGTPPLDDLPAWLCIMQHHGLPTRLLDWTESAAAALFFAVEQSDLFRKWEKWDDLFHPIVWIVNPHALNWVSAGGSPVPRTATDEGAGNPRDGVTPQWGLQNILAAFNPFIEDLELPMAVHPMYVHVRLQTQKSRFTVHGSRREGLEELFRPTDLMRLGFLGSVEIEKDAAIDIVKELQRIGVSRSTLFPDLEGLGTDLAARLAHP